MIEELNWIVSAILEVLEQGSMVRLWLQNEQVEPSKQKRKRNDAQFAPKGGRGQRSRVLNQRWSWLCTEAP